MKRALVTGASRGIGLAIVKRLLSEGWEVIGIARNFSSHLPAPFTGVEMDLSDLKTLPERLQALRSQYSSIDAIVSNAGQGQFGHLEQMSYSKILSLLNINFLSHVYLVKTFLPLMKKQKRGDVVFIGSEAAREGKRKGSLYCASKFALRGFAQALRDECASSQVRISVVNPGMVETEFFRHLSFRPGTEANEHLIPEDVAEAVSLILHARQGTVFDEINLSPQKKTILWSS